MHDKTNDVVAVNITQSVAILVDGNNIERSLHNITGDNNVMVNFDVLIPKLLKGRGLSRLIYFKEGKAISTKLADRLLNNFMGSVVPCHKSADIPLTISATQIARKVDTIIVLSGDADYIELVKHLKGEGVRVEIAAVEKTTASILIESADLFIPITVEDSFTLSPKSRRYPSKSNNETKSSKQKPVESKTKSKTTSNPKEEKKPKSRNQTQRKPKTNEKAKPKPKSTTKARPKPKPRSKANTKSRSKSTRNTRVSKK